MRKEIKERIMESRRSAQECAGFLLKTRPLSRDVFDEQFKKYMCSKFMLQPEEAVTDDFYELCQISADKAANLPKGVLDAAELASKCGGATTAMNKKVLFLLAVNREFGIRITAEESVKIQKFSQLQQLVFDKLQEL